MSVYFLVVLGGYIVGWAGPEPISACYDRVTQWEVNRRQALYELKYDQPVFERVRDTRFRCAVMFKRPRRGDRFFSARYQ